MQDNAAIAAVGRYSDFVLSRFYITADAAEIAAFHASFRCNGEKNLSMPSNLNAKRHLRGRG